MTLNSYISTKYKDILSNLDLSNSISLSNSLFSSLQNATVKNVKLVFNDVSSFGTREVNLKNDFGVLTTLANNCTISNCSISINGEMNLSKSFGGIIYESINSIVSGNSFEMIGNINVNGSNAGGIVGKSTNSIIAFNNNGLTGNIQSSNVLGGIVGLSTSISNEIYGNINNMLGNLGRSNVSTTNVSSIGGIVGKSILGDNITININAMEGNLLDYKSNCGGIIGDSKGSMKYNYNSMIGSINGSGLVNTCSGIVKYNLNNMKGNCDKSAGISNVQASSVNDINNNYIAMNGQIGNIEFNNIVSSGTSNYGFSNTSNLVLQDITIAIPLDTYIDYIDNIDLPVIKETQYTNVNLRSNLLNGPAPYWGLYYPNNNTLNNTIITKNQLYRYNSNLITNSNISKLYSNTIGSTLTSNLLTSTSSNIFPLKVYKYRGLTSKNDYKTVLSNVIKSNSNNIKNYVEASYYNTLMSNINAKGKSNIYLDDIFSISDTLLDIDKDAVKTALTTSLINGDKISLLNKDLLYKRKPQTTINKDNFVRKNNIYVASSNLLSLSSNSEILSSDSSIYITSNLTAFNLTIGSLNLRINTSTADSNYITINY